VLYRFSKTRLQLHNQTHFPKAEVLKTGEVLRNLHLHSLPLTDVAVFWAERVVPPGGPGIVPCTVIFNDGEVFVLVVVRLTLVV